MSSVTYCTGWDSYRKKAPEALSADRARQLHQGRKPYTAIVEDESGWVVVEMCFFQAYCHVLFLDDQKRVAERYSFVETADGRLFLEEARVNYYPNDGDRPSQYELFRFKEDGGLVHDTQKAGGPIKRREGHNSGYDLTRNYAAIPAFGSYDSVTARER